MENISDVVVFNRHHRVGDFFVVRWHIEGSSPGVAAFICSSQAYITFTIYEWNWFA